MRKLLIIFAGISSLSFASSLDMSTLSCNNKFLLRGTTLKDVQENCLIKEQSITRGMLQVDFINDTTGKEVSCLFPSTRPSAYLNSCHD